MSFEHRYAKNKNMLSDEEMTHLAKKRVCVVGCGGLGGYVIEFLTRLGIGHITVIDGDVFDETNLNRQLISTESLLGYSKAMATYERMISVNSEIEIIPVVSYVTDENAHSILAGHDLVIDALDNISSRKIVADACFTLEIPFIHGAIAGWYGQVSTIFPGDKSFSHLYRNTENKGEEQKLGNPSFTPALVASIEVSEAVKVLLGRGDLLRNKFLHIDLFSNEFEVFDL
jgi:molybdopterin/thiamine biosynthesis adenylyltransferase